MRRRENVVLGHMKDGARIPQRRPRVPQRDSSSCSKLSLLYTLSRAAQLTQSQVCSLFYDGKEPVQSQISLASGYALGRRDTHTDGLSTSMATDLPRHTPGTYFWAGDSCKLCYPRLPSENSEPSWAKKHCPDSSFSPFSLLGFLVQF